MLCQAQAKSRAPPIFHGARQRLRKIPNIKGRITYTAANDPRATSYEANSALYYAYPEQAVKTQYDYSTENKIPADPAIDASRSSSLYQDDLTEVRVNAVFGLNLIRAF